MKGKPIFIVDVDDVLRNTSQGIVNVYNNEFGTHLSKEDCKNYDVDVSYPLIKKMLGLPAFEWLFDVKAKEVLFESNPIEGAAEGIRKLKEIGTVVICTNQVGYKNKVLTLKWLENNGFVYDDICFMENKNLLSGTYFIDDNPENFRGSMSKYGILIDMPFNRNVSVKNLCEEESFCKKIYRFKNFTEFTEKITKIYKKSNNK